jgi:hypothetical protein
MNRPAAEGMPGRGATPAEVVGEVGSLAAVLGVLTMALFPLALPGLLLAIAPLALVPVVGLLAILFVLPVWLARVVLRGRPRRRSSVPTAGDSTWLPERST